MGKNAKNIEGNLVVFKDLKIFDSNEGEDKLINERLKNFLI